MRLMLTKFDQHLLTAKSVAAENASGIVVETTREGAMTIAVAVMLVLFFSHQPVIKYSKLDFYKD